MNFKKSTPDVLNLRLKKRFCNLNQNYRCLYFYNLS